MAHYWRHWRTALVFVQPDTVVRWHREWLRRRWSRRSSHRRMGHPIIDQEIRTLVREMATANPLWGAPRIHGEFHKLGVEVSERTVSRLMPRRRPPSQTWRTFLANHLTSIVSMDFFTVSTLTGRVLFVLTYYHRSRTHLGLNKDTPEGRPVPHSGEIVVTPEVGGLHHRYDRRAA